MSGARPDVSIIVPFLDERDNLDPLARELGDTMRGMESTTFEVIFVDDGSTDGGADVLTGPCDADPRLAVISHSRNRGQSAALVTGFAASRGDVVVTLDADLQNPPAEIPKLLHLLEEGSWDVVLGVRAVRQDRWRVRAAGRVANSVRRWVLRDGVVDVGCGPWAFRREMLDEVPVFDGLHRFLPAFWRARGARIAQIPVEHRPRLHGRSKYTIHGRLWRGIADLLGVRWLIARSIHDREQSDRQQNEERDE